MNLFQIFGQKKMNRTTNKWSTQLNTEHRKLNIEQHEPHYKTGVESGVSEEWKRPCPASGIGHVTHVIFEIDANIHLKMCYCLYDI
jgi:hypothetical protein